MRVTAVINPKGGTGKTTTAVNLAATAALAGERVLLVDLDEQGSSTQWLGGSPDGSDLVPVLLTGRSLDALVVPTNTEGLELVPGSAELAEDTRITREPGHQFLLREALDNTVERDWVLVDCPGDLGPLTIMGMTAATDVLIPLTAGSLELDEVPKIRMAIAKVRARLNPGLAIAGVVVVRVDLHGRYRSVVARDVVTRLQADFPGGEVLQAVVRENPRHREAPGWRQPIAEFDPGGWGDQDYRGVLAELRARRAEVADVR